MDTVTAEQWRPCLGAANYDVSNLGRVRSRLHVDQYTGALLILSPALNGGGYLQLELRCDDGRTRSRLVHRLVAEAFLGPAPFPGATVSHKSDVKVDNRAEALEWASRAENNKKTYANGCRTVHRHRGDLPQQIVRCIRQRADSGETAAEIAKALELPVGVVRLAAIGATYRWVKASAIETEAALRRQAANDRRIAAERRAAVASPEVEAAALERAAPPEQRRRKVASPHTPPASGPRSKTK